MRQGCSEDMLEVSAAVKEFRRVPAGVRSVPALRSAALRPIPLAALIRLERAVVSYGGSLGCASKEICARWKIRLRRCARDDNFAEKSTRPSLRAAASLSEEGCCEEVRRDFSRRRGPWGGGKVSPYSDYFLRFGFGDFRAVLHLLVDDLGDWVGNGGQAAEGEGFAGARHID